MHPSNPIRSRLRTYVGRPLQISHCISLISWAVLILCIIAAAAPLTFLDPFHSVDCWRVFGFALVHELVNDPKTLYAVLGSASLILLSAYLISKRDIALDAFAVRFIDSLCLLLCWYIFRGGLAPLSENTGQWWALATIFCLLLGVIYCIPSHCRSLIKAISFVLFVQCGYAVYDHWRGINQFITPGFGSRTCGTLDNPNSLYPLCMIGFFLNLSLARCSTLNKWSRIFYCIASLTAWVALLLTYSRAGWIGAGSALIVFCEFPRVRMNWDMRALTLVLAIVTIYMGLSVRTHGRLPGQRYDRSGYGRLVIWAAAVEIIRSHPIIGTGTGNYGLEQSMRMNPELQELRARNAEPKNLLLYIFSELGIIGFALFGTAIFRGVVLLRHAAENLESSALDKMAALGVKGAGTAILVAGLFDTPILETRRFASTLIMILLIVCVGRIASTEKSLTSTSFPVP